MRSTIAIAKREILSFFVSPIAYIVITGYTLLAGYFFFNLLAIFNIILQRFNTMPYRGGMEAPNLNQWVVENFYQTLVVVLVFLIPLLTMRLLADEKRTGTFELLVTSQLSVGEIVLGKFLGVLFVIFVMTVLIFVFPALLCLLGSPIPEIGPIVSGLLAIFLCSVAFTSISMGVSSFTENQIVAAVSSMVVLLLLFVIQSPAESLGDNWQKVLEYLSPVMQIRDMIKGVITIKSVVYFLSLTSVGLFISLRALEAHRWR